MKKINFELSINLFELIRKSAYDNKVSISEMLRIIIKTFYGID